MKNAAIFLMLLLCGFKCNKESETTIEDFSKHVRIKADFDRSSHVVKVHVSLDPNIHAYGDKETVGRPVNLVIDESGNYKAQGPLHRPKSISKKFADGQTSFVLEKDFSVEQKVSDGTGPLNATFYLQVCSHHQCDRPRTYQFTF